MRKRSKSSFQIHPNARFKIYLHQPPCSCLGGTSAPTSSMPSSPRPPSQWMEHQAQYSATRKRFALEMMCAVAPASCCSHRCCRLHRSKMKTRTRTEKNAMMKTDAARRRRRRRGSTTMDGARRRKAGDWRKIRTRYAVCGQRDPHCSHRSC